MGRSTKINKLEFVEKMASLGYRFDVMNSIINDYIFYNDSGEKITFKTQREIMNWKKEN